jgi:hypothetical protein
MIMPPLGRCFGGTPQDPVPPIIEAYDFIWRHRVRPERKAGVLL